MEIYDEILANGETDEIVSFLSYYIPMTFSDTEFKTNVDFKRIDELIKSGPKEYLDPLCLKACKELWKKNIYVLDSVNYDNDLYLIFDKLDKENALIFKANNKENPNNYYKNLGKEKYFGVKVEDYLSKAKTRVEKEFCDLTSVFKMQDIPRGYLSEKNFLMEICNCEKVEGIKEYQQNNPEVRFDVQKMEKTFREYLQETGYEKLYKPEEHRIYLTDFYYNSHQEYLESLETNDDAVSKKITL